MSILAAQIGDGLIDHATELRGPQVDSRSQPPDHVGEDRRFSRAGHRLKLSYEGDLPAPHDVGAVRKIGNRRVNQLAGSFLLKIEQFYLSHSSSLPESSTMCICARISSGIWQNFQLAV